MRKLFISYSRKDSDFVQRLAASLRNDDVVVWVDSAEIEVGQSISGIISEAIRNHGYFVPILSPDYLASRWCRRELNAGIFSDVECRGTLLPVLYRDCEIPSLISDKSFADFRNSYEAGYSALVAALHEARKTLSELTIKPANDLILGNLVCHHMSSFGVDVQACYDTLSHHSITFTRDAWGHNGPNEHDFSIEFDLTSCAASDLRLIGLDIEVRSWKPVCEILRGVPYMGLGDKRIFFGLFRKELGAYPCSFSVPRGYVRLSPREMEVVQMQVNTPNEGVYDLGVLIHYSVAGRVETISSKTLHDLWFVDSRSIPREW